jgi:RNA polymerase sigma-70 factor, ECF subfamily
MSIVSGPIEVPRIEDDLERHRVALTRHCARMLGSRSEAEDAVQETLLRAWRGHAKFQGRSALPSWLHRIATNVCIDMLNDRSRRAVPVDPAPLQSAPIEADTDTDPVAQTLVRETFRLALLAAIERLPARQRAVLLLREVMCWRASEVAELLGTSTAAVNSALQRARTALDSRPAGTSDTMTAAVDDSHRKLVASYLSAFEFYVRPDLGNGRR